MAKDIGHQVRNVNPLLSGRYWVLLTGPSIGAFDNWRTFNKGLVKVEASELAADPLANEFVIFKVIAPAFLWDAKILGFPNTAPPGIRFRDDIEGFPGPEPDPTDKLTDIFDNAAGIVSFTLAGLGLFILAKFRKVIR